MQLWQVELFFLHKKVPVVLYSKFMDFVRSHIGKMQLWPVEHFFLHNLEYSNKTFNLQTSD